MVDKYESYHESAKHGGSLSKTSPFEEEKTSLRIIGSVYTKGTTVTIGYSTKGEGRHVCTKRNKIKRILMS